MNLPYNKFRQFSCPCTPTAEITAKHTVLGHRTVPLVLELRHLIGGRQWHHLLTDFYVSSCRIPTWSFGNQPKISQLHNYEAIIITGILNVEFSIVISEYQKCLSMEDKINLQIKKQESYLCQLTSRNSFTQREKKVKNLYYMTLYVRNDINFRYKHKKQKRDKMETSETATYKR